MGLEGLSLRHLLVVLVIVALVFGTKKLRNMGGDLGAAMKSFRNAIHDNDDEDKSESAQEERTSLAQDPVAPAQAAQENVSKSAERGR